MSRVKCDLSHVSLNQLSTLTGKTFRTLKKTLADVAPKEIEPGVLMYSPAEVLPIIYGADKPQAPSGSGEFLDPVRERARLDKLKADKVELEVQILKEKLIPIERVESSWSKLVAAFRAKILSMPQKLAPKLSGTTETKEVEKILKKECNEALAELSHYGAGLDRSRTNAKSS